MRRTSTDNLSKLYEESCKYDDEFINSISLTNIKDNAELKELLSKVKQAYLSVTNYYLTMYNDYIKMINTNIKYIPQSINTDSIRKYKHHVNKIQKVYSYLLYLCTFENPFQSV